MAGNPSLQPPSKKSGKWIKKRPQGKSIAGA